MTQLVSYYKDKPVDLKGKVEIAQHPIASSTQFRSSEGAVQPGAVYVVVPSTVTRGLLVPPLERTTNGPYGTGTTRRYAS